MEKHKHDVWLYITFCVFSPLVYIVNLPQTTALEQICLRYGRMRSGERDNGPAQKQAAEVATRAVPAPVKFTTVANIQKHTMIQQAKCKYVHTCIITSIYICLSK